MSDLHPWPRQGLTIDFLQHVRVGAERVWTAFTTEADLQQWLGVSHAEVPLTEGEAFSLQWISQGRLSGETTHGNTGRVRHVLPGRLLALEWNLQFADGTTGFSLQLQPSFMEYGFDRGPECDIWIVQSGFPTEGTGLFEYDGMLRHWRQVVGNLVAWLEDRPARSNPYAVAGMEIVGGARDQGILVADVVIDAPAHKAGIRPGDLVRSIDGGPLHSLDDFHDWIAARSHGDRGDFELADGRHLTVTVESVEVALERFRIRHGDSWDAPDSTILKEAPA
jgi:uncharacterized protein YndB with AHSA1/START domain